MRNNTKYNESTTAVKPEVVKAAVAKLGISPWTVPSSGETRYYLNSDELEKIGAIIVFRYKSGNVKHFAIWDTVENKFRKSANRRAYDDTFNTFIDDSGFVYTDYELEGGFLTAIVDRLNRFVAEDLAKEKEDKEATVAEDTPTEPVADKNSEDKNNTVVTDALESVPVTKKAAVDAGLKIVSAAGWQSKPTRKAMQSLLEERGFKGTVGSLRAALENLIAYPVAVNVTLPAKPETTPVETVDEPAEAPSVRDLGVAAAAIPTPVTVVKVDEEQAGAETPAESDAEASAESDNATQPKPEPATVDEVAESIADRLMWMAEVPKTKALKLLACAYLDKDEVSNDEFLDLMNGDTNPLPDYAYDLQSVQMVSLKDLHRMMSDIAVRGCDDRTDGVSA